MTAPTTEERMARWSRPNATTDKWSWMMDWCKRNGLPPAKADVWESAAKAYDHQRSNSA